MPTYTEALFEPLEAWIVRADLLYEAADDLRLIVAKMLLEHSGRGVSPIPAIHFPLPPAITEAEAEELRERIRSGKAS